MLVGVLRPGVLRVADHLGVTDDDVDQALERIPRALGVLVARASGRRRSRRQAPRRRSRRSAPRRASELDFPPASRSAASSAAPPITAISTCRNESASGLIAHASTATAGIRKTATCALEESAISVASFTLPRRATTTAPPCSAALPTMATMTAATKKSLRWAFSANVSIEWTRISATTAVAAVAIASTIIESRRDQASACGVADVELAVTPQRRLVTTT